MHFLDPQSGELDVEYYFDMAVDGMTKFARIDNLDPNESLVKGFCMEVKHGHFRRSRRNCQKNFEPTLRLYGEYGEIEGYYVFHALRARDNSILPGGFDWTVDKETGEFKCTRIKRESLKPYAKPVGYTILGEFN